MSPLAKYFQKAYLYEFIKRVSLTGLYHICLKNDIDSHEENNYSARASCLLHCERSHSPNVNFIATNQRQKAHCLYGHMAVE